MSEQRQRIIVMGAAGMAAALLQALHAKGIAAEIAEPEVRLVDRLEMPAMEPISRPTGKQQAQWKRETKRGRR